MTPRAAMIVPATLEAADAATVDLRGRASALLAEEQLARFELAASEALTNIVRHAYGGKAGGEIDIELFEAPDHAVTLVLRDRGEAPPAGTFDLKNLPDVDEVDVFALPEGGWGVGLLHQCADEIGFQSDARGNRLTLRFKPA
ncbi:ATP-binding protein [Jiella mangrovi]|uniref:ATP-binding protein n=1 Tax=Jiella mangrovi TaxID=2821407 RepID=A0ABS4BIB4_9HYPH|nr:ATP-binding protein [Jiella mangrovi]MBP0616493.1 ATP-binding protein [Jiella mangrovi]